MTKMSVADDNAKKMPEEKRPPLQLPVFATSFRELENFFEVVSVLTYGARNDSYDVRLNSVLILGNILDENTVCIPLAQLFDFSLQQKPSYVNGRANLLAVTAVVATYAYSEDFDNIKRVQRYFSDKIDSDSSSLKTTGIILKNIEQRLGLQEPASNKSVPLPPNKKAKCKAYAEGLPANADRRENIRY